MTDLSSLLRRYAGASEASLSAVLCPLLIPVSDLDRTVFKAAGQSHWRATFSVEINDENYSALQVGRTGKFLPAESQAGGGWREIAKGRIIEVDEAAAVAHGEVYVGGSKAKLVDAVAELNVGDVLEIDQYGAAAKILSALAENAIVEDAKSSGYRVKRMPEDMARHLGAYTNFDFLFERGDEVRRVEAKSLWGTNTDYARLIHSTTTKPQGAPDTWTDRQKKNYYPTSSCKFTTQDIFAVSLFLRTGNISDIAYARSVPVDDKPYGLPRSSGFPEHVHQNPKCKIGDGVWFATIDEVWDL